MILGRESITLRRQSGSVSWGSDGRPSASTADTTIQASVQPLGERELQRLPEGFRQRDPRRIYTESELRTADQHGDTVADLVVIDSVVYQVQSVTRHRSVIPHYRGLLLRIQEAA